MLRVDLFEALSASTRNPGVTDHNRDVEALDTRKEYPWPIYGTGIFTYT